MPVKFFLLSLLIIFFSFCRDTHPNREMDAYFEKQIKHRQAILSAAFHPGDSLVINTAEIENEINDLILLSKDIENLAACINRSDAYFKTVSAQYGINFNDFVPVHTGMHIHEIASVLKQNELNLLNQLILKKDPSLVALLTAQ